MNAPQMRRSLAATAGAAAALILPALSAHAQGTAPTPPRPKIGAKQAEAAAQKKLGGKVVSSKYEFEDGRWQYAVLIQKGKDLYEAEVSATTGKVLDTEKTSAAEEAQEDAANKKKAASAHPGGKKAAAEKGEKGERGEAGEKGE